MEYVAHFSYGESAHYIEKLANNAAALDMMSVNH
jgi:hypothetical protein